MGYMDHSQRPDFIFRALLKGKSGFGQIVNRCKICNEKEGDRPTRWYSYPYHIDCAVARLNEVLEYYKQPYRIKLEMVKPGQKCERAGCP